MSLTQSQRDRYARSILLEPIGRAGQEKLLASSVLIVGVGGLGSPAALYLAAAGVGTIGLLDGDRVDLSNLQRQIAHGTADVGERKVVSAREAIVAINADVTARTYDQWATADCLPEIVAGYDFVIDAVDNFATKLLINDACCARQVPFCHAGILEFEGQLMTVLPGRTACCRCVFGGWQRHAQLADGPFAPERQPSATARVAAATQAGVLGVVPGVIGTLQATEAIKAILGIGDLLTDSLLTYDALSMRFRKVCVPRNPHCPACAGRS